MSNPSDNKRLAKNTLYLYFRMLMLLVVGLYTSRVTLIALGISDYGIYNVVGGLVTMFSFLNYALVNSTQRYITYELGKGDLDKQKLVFSTSLNIHALVSVVLVFLSETIGLWFVLNQMVIPNDRMCAAIWVFQFSIFSCVLTIMSAPYYALIIAHEKMSAFAYISMLEALMKLLIVIILLNSNGDRLIVYAALLMCITTFIRFIYGFYCNKHFKESKYRFIVDKRLTKAMMRFTGWSLFGNFSYVCYTQGLNLLLNVFFNPIVNAARGIAVQVQAVISNFSNNIQNAITPQITKSYAQGDMKRMHTLIYLNARLSFYVIFVISLPILCEAHQILNLWLAVVPEHTINFVRLIILVSLVDSTTSPLLPAAQATGDIKKYQIMVSFLCFLILPVSYVSLKILAVPEIVFIITLVIMLIVQMIKLIVVGKQVNLSIREYSKIVFFRLLIVQLICFLLVYPFVYIMEESVYRLLLIIAVSLISVTFSAYALGLRSVERLYVNKKLVIAAKKIINHY